MRSPLFAFELQKLDQIQPWGAPHDPNLHWFGLSNGTYWMSLGEVTLFEYSRSARDLGAPHCCEYEVVRLYEDILAIAPYVLEAVPPELQQFIALDVESNWDRYWHAWRDLPDHLHTTPDSTDLLEAGADWLGHRTLDSLYLSTPLNVRMWSDVEHVHIQWDNRGREFEGIPVWAASTGTYLMPREVFAEAVLSFHSRFMAQMDDRVQRVLAGELSSRIRIDCESLVREQRERSLPIDHELARPVIATDWSLVAQAIQHLERFRDEA